MRFPLRRDKLQIPNIIAAKRYGYDVLFGGHGKLSIGFSNLPA